MKTLYDIIIVGAGPAGLAAAQAAAASGASICIIDDNPFAGGQIWRGGPQQQKDSRARELWQQVQQAPNISVLHSARVLYAPAPGELLVQLEESVSVLRYQRLILATGARELLLPFPGWTLPGVTGAGGLQALSKGGYPVDGKRIVVAGTGPLLLAVADTLRSRGAQVQAIIEQAPRAALVRFALGLLATPSKISQALQLGSRLRGVSYRSGRYVRAAFGEGQLQRVELDNGELIECDYLAVGYGLLPNTELARSLGCAVGQGAVQVDEWQRTSMPAIYCAGEGTGVGGVDLALAEGRIAGLHASRLAGAGGAASALAERARWRRFAGRLAEAFRLREEISKLAAPDTIVCRCEDVPHSDLAVHATWRAAKLHTRCGMGPCQGRICGAATAVLYGWQPDTVRTPIYPARAGSIIATTTET
ncbi:FAD-dependent oxidoreductase [Pseudoduganella sp. RAF53_2]|uniref:FAD-dependent oxidoreductase n=1 Tax=unclassified Pseudoduganella TaxID=2637179 RepID=UPI003F9E29B6